MTSGIHLVSAVTDAGQFWPHLAAILHWHRNPGPVERLFLLAPENDTTLEGPAATAALLERVLRSACPGLRVERRTTPPSPDALARHLIAWHAEAPAESWLLLHPGLGPTPSWGLDDLLLLPGFRIAQRRPDGDWFALQRTAPGAEITAEPLPAFRAEASDEWAIADLVRAQTSEAPNPAPLVATPAKPLPLLPLTQAAMTAGWDWKLAFSTACAEASQESDSQLFLRYLGAFLLDLGLRNVVIGIRRPRSSNPASPSPTEPLLWIQHGGRLWIVDARLDASPASPEPDSHTPPTLPPLAALVLRTNDARRDLGALKPEWIVVRPCQTLQPVEQSLADALGVRVLDETTCRDLPARLAAWFGLPLSADAVEIERRLRTHLAESGRTRVFGPEPAVLQQQRTAAPDPVVVPADALLEQVQRARGQNWLLWTHAERVHLRVPSEGRSSASGDWRAMLAAFVGLDPASVQTRQSPRVVLLDFPETPDHRRRVADWLRPFLNASLTFDTARARFAAEARVTAEAESAARANSRTPASPPSPPSPSPAGSAPASTRAPRPAPTAKPSPPRPAPTPQGAPPRRMQRVSLEDLDRALDSALTGPSDPPGGADPAKR